MKDCFVVSRWIYKLMQLLHKAILLWGSTGTENLAHMFWFMEIFIAFKSCCLLLKMICVRDTEKETWPIDDVETRSKMCSPPGLTLVYHGATANCQWKK